MAKVDIPIDKVTSRVCVVKTKELDSKKGQRANWVNNTGKAVVVFFPHDDVFDEDGDSKGKRAGRRGKRAGGTKQREGKTGKRFFQLIPKDGEYKTGPVNGNKTGPFRYAVFCFATGRFAIGGSDPEIIVL